MLLKLLFAELQGRGSKLFVADVQPCLRRPSSVLKSGYTLMSQSVTIAGLLRLRNSAEVCGALTTVLWSLIETSASVCSLI